MISNGDRSPYHVKKKFSIKKIVKKIVEMSLTSEESQSEMEGVAFANNKKSTIQKKQKNGSCSLCDTMKEIIQTKFITVIKDISQIAREMDKEHESFHNSLTDTIDTVNLLIDQVNSNQEAIEKLKSYMLSSQRDIRCLKYEAKKLRFGGFERGNVVIDSNAKDSGPADNANVQNLAHEISRIKRDLKKLKSDNEKNETNQNNSEEIKSLVSEIEEIKKSSKSNANDIKSLKKDMHKIKKDTEQEQPPVDKSEAMEKEIKSLKSDLRKLKRTVEASKRTDKVENTNENVKTNENENTNEIGSENGNGNLALLFKDVRCLKYEVKKLRTISENAPLTLEDVNKINYNIKCLKFEVKKLRTLNENEKPKQMKRPPIKPTRKPEDSPSSNDDSEPIHLQHESKVMNHSMEIKIIKNELQKIKEENGEVEIDQFQKSMRKIKRELKSIEKRMSQIEGGESESSESSGNGAKNSQIVPLYGKNSIAQRVEKLESQVIDISNIVATLQTNVTQVFVDLPHKDTVDLVFRSNPNPQ
ncbi:hypothetical protein TRFO_30844 [Tritrichomonas foetus]|uniref:Uncharacterized protein n=1 Tax=Tritrichomonas foetus TaxID=1144522 RepID=A0A1J4JSU4_9EUKA|nr:hypothetical protein TRFO_30844 [Tritrichomonas foetus]|eukprot:OHT02177.1 hypothetical protein TRFO_30844 [Tritrichomonas foetus]